MTGVNKVILLGHLGADPQIRTMESGGKVASFSIATSESWRDKATGERHEKTEWHRVVIFNETLVKVAEQYLKKGAKVYVEGKQQSRKWTDKANVERYVTETVLGPFGAQIVMLDKREGVPPAEGPDAYGTSKSTGEQPSLSKEMDDEIPF